MKHTIKRRVRRLLEGYRVAVLLGPCKDWGQCNYEEHTLIVRKSLSPQNKVTTLIHEAIHYLEPEFSEEQVLRLEEEVVRSLTEHEMNFFYKRLREALRNGA